MGIRSSIANEKALTTCKYTFREYPLPYLGKLPERTAMLLFLDAKAEMPRITWPSTVSTLLKEAINERKQVRPEYKAFLKMIFANSPLPLTFQAGISGDRREIIDRLIGSSLVWKDEELALQRAFPILYSSLRPLITNDEYPECVRKVLEYVLNQSDSLLREYPHIEEYYGLPRESKLECFPLWPLERGITTYTKDKKVEDQLECSEKVVGENRKLSPGLMLVT
ncbi:hypothetical protein PENTCL1PPCAC_27576, partial [Pristionchus entomophagus]